MLRALIINSIRKACLVAIPLSLFIYSSSLIEAQDETFDKDRLVQIRAATLFYIAQFINIPESSFPDSKSPFLICLFGNDAINPIISESAHEQEIKGRAVRVELLGKPKESSNHSCTITYFGEALSDEQVSTYVKEHPRALTMGATLQSIQHGCMIRISEKENKLHIQIQIQRLKQAGMVASSDLLGIATIAND